MATYDTVYTDISEGIFTLTLHRPEKMNAFNQQMVDDMVAALDAADADDSARAIIITGSGDRAFCAGADLSGGAETFDYAARNIWDDSDSPQREDGTVDLSHPSVRDGGGIVSLRIFNCKKPVIGAINGAAVGVGATMTLPMDFRMAADTARFGFVFSKRGICPEAASSWFLPRIVGIENALQWCYSGKVFSAQEALEKGLVRSLHPAGDLMDAARAFAREFIEGTSPVTVALARQMLWRMMGAPHPMIAHQLDSRLVWSRGKSADGREGVASFLEKRPPNFPDKVSSDMPHFRPWMDDPLYE